MFHSNFTIFWDFFKFSLVINSTTFGRFYQFLVIIHKIIFLIEYTLRDFLLSYQNQDIKNYDYFIDLLDISNKIEDVIGNQY